jgi:rRNA maturation protein Nop10
MKLQGQVKSGNGADIAKPPLFDPRPFYAAQRRSV